MISLSKISSKISRLSPLNYPLSPFLVKSSHLSNPFLSDQTTTIPYFHFPDSRDPPPPRRHEKILPQFQPKDRNSFSPLQGTLLENSPHKSRAICIEAASPPATNLFFFFHDLVISRSTKLVFLSSRRPTDDPISYRSPANVHANTSLNACIAYVNRTRTDGRACGNENI